MKKRSIIFVLPIISVLSGCKFYIFEPAFLPKGNEVSLDAFNNKLKELNSHPFYSNNPYNNRPNNKSVFEYENKYKTTTISNGTEKNENTYSTEKTTKEYDLNNKVITYKRNSTYQHIGKGSKESGYQKNETNKSQVIQKTSNDEIQVIDLLEKTYRIDNTDIGSGGDTFYDLYDSSIANEKTTCEQLIYQMTENAKNSSEEYKFYINGNLLTIKQETNVIDNKTISACEIEKNVVCTAQLNLNNEYKLEFLYYSKVNTTQNYNAKYLIYNSGDCVKVTNITRFKFTINKANLVLNQIDITDFTKV